MNKRKTWVIVDVIWLTLIMAGLVLAMRHDSIQEYIHYISLMIWYIGAAYLSSTWEK